VVQYILAGLALGSIYAIASAGLVVTFTSAGVLNFAFGSMAYAVARVFYWLNTQHGWGTGPAAVVALLVAAPLLGVLLYAVLFRFLRLQSTLVKLVSTVGLSVALPAIVNLVFGNQTITASPGLAPATQTSFTIFGAPVGTEEVITYGFVLFVVLAGTLTLRLTSVGLKVRAMVDSQALTGLAGTSPGRVALGVWAVTGVLAGVAGVLAAPVTGLTPEAMTTLMAAAFAAVVAARLRSLWAAVVISLAMGVVTDVIQEYLPASSSFTAAVIPSIPFAFILVFLVIYVLRAGTVDEDSGGGGVLDRAIRVTSQARVSGAAAASRGWRSPGALLPVLPLVVVAVLPLIFRDSAYWLGLVTLGLCYAIALLSYTIVTGEGGMIWLSQIIFAGVGALGTAQFVIGWHLPVLVAIVPAALVAAAVGAVMALLTVRLGDLYVGLVTLSFGLLVETLVFTRLRFAQDGLGVVVSPPGFARSVFVLAYLALGVFLLAGLVVVNLRRSTTGLALSAVRDSEPAARTLGLSVVQMKVLAAALAAFVAAVGGGFLAIDSGGAQPASYDVFLGLVWLAVVVTVGVRSVAAAAIAGLAFAVLPGVFASYVPARLGDVPSLLFGLGAVLIAVTPDGVLAANARMIRRLAARRLPAGRPPAGPAALADGPPAVAATTVTGAGGASAQHPAGGSAQLGPGA
jgi:branched-chain amino acid transport system permease protein